MGRTATSAAIVTVVAFLLGYPYAYLMTRVGPVARGVLLTIVLIPFWTSALARNFGWLVLIYRGGPVQTASLLSRFRRGHALRHRHRRHAGDEPGDAAVHGAAALQRARRHRPPLAAGGARPRLAALVGVLEGLLAALGAGAVVGHDPRVHAEPRLLRDAGPARLAAAIDDRPAARRSARPSCSISPAPARSARSCWS